MPAIKILAIMQDDLIYKKIDMTKKIRIAKSKDIPIIADYNIAMAMETEGKILNKEIITAGVSSIINDNSKGIYWVVEIEEEADLLSPFVDGFGVKVSSVKSFILLMCRRFFGNFRPLDNFSCSAVRIASLLNKLPNKTSNGYMKLWEIYNSIPNLVPNKQHVKVFHLAEAPGQWINCTRHYLETKKRFGQEMADMYNLGLIESFIRGGS